MTACACVNYPFMCAVYYEIRVMSVLILAISGNGNQKGESSIRRVGRGSIYIASQ